MNPTGHGTCGPTGLAHFTGEAAHRVDRATYLTTGPGVHGCLASLLVAFLGDGENVTLERANP